MTPAATMAGVRIHRHGGLDALEWGELPQPRPGPGEVLVELRSCGLNHLDLWVRRGVPGHSFPLPLVPGSDGAGVVVDRGPGAEAIPSGLEVILSPGLSCGVCVRCLSGRDNLCREYGILGETRDGTCASLVAVPAANLIPKPRSVPWPEAGCFALVAITAWTMLVDKARIQPGEEILVLAGGSGVGTLSIQIAKLFGCRVIATAGGGEKCARVLELGADEVIDHRSEAIAARVKTLTCGRGVDVVVEHIGEETWEESLRALAWGGRLVTCGATTGAQAALDLRALFFKSLSILGSTMGSKGEVPRLVKLLEAGKLRPIVARTLPLSRIGEGQRLLEERQVVGKVVAIPDPHFEELGGGGGTVESGGPAA